MTEQDLPRAIILRNEKDNEEKKIHGGKVPPIIGGKKDLEELKDVIDDFLIRNPRGELRIINKDHPNNELNLPQEKSGIPKKII